ncbi:MAG TPA: chloride channel protein, partial [Chitinophagaceae bacterium]|nr:chloride channel protein [Chitinophagaceae bacterium]
MLKNDALHRGIPISVSLKNSLLEEDMQPKAEVSKHRTIVISAIAVCVAIGISFIARFLVYLINVVTGLSFYGSAKAAEAGPAGNHLGLWVILIPVIGGVIVGLMALYGSKAIRGHGIPEAMETILTNQSKIKPTITYLKPLSSAIAIGTGGPFGAEGPIIATGGALGSTLGQALKISHNERKVLLAAGATAGMAAIFGSPVAAIFLAIELLLFEFSPRSIIPVALACITGAAGHHLLFGQDPVFEIKGIIASPSNAALFVYSIIGLLMGLLSVATTKIVYFIEDLFEKLPVHWMWWPAIGAVAVGVVGYFYPRTLGVGYNNITDVLNQQLTLQVILSLFLFKFISWAIALGSGTSGGTLAPLMTIGGAAGALAGMLATHFFPEYQVNIGMAALVGMSAMFAGASRALLTSIIFALETTGQSNALLPLLAACTGSYFVSFFLMENTIMTEKIARRGIRTPDSYEPDLLSKMSVSAVMKKDGLVLSEENTVEEVREWMQKQEYAESRYFIVVSEGSEFSGIVQAADLLAFKGETSLPIQGLISKKRAFIDRNDSLKMAVDTMVREKTDVIPVLSEERDIVGLISINEIFAAYRMK